MLEISIKGAKDKNLNMEVKFNLKPSQEFPKSYYKSRNLKLIVSDRRLFNYKDRK